jgi:hypothetical protein
VSESQPRGMADDATGFLTMRLVYLRACAALDRRGAVVVIVATHVTEFVRTLKMLLSYGRVTPEISRFIHGDRAPIPHSHRGRGSIPLSQD